MSPIYTIEVDGKPLAAHTTGDHRKALGVIAELLSLGWAPERIRLHLNSRDLCNYIVWKVRVTNRVTSPGAESAAAEHHTTIVGGL